MAVRIRKFCHENYKEYGLTKRENWVVSKSNRDTQVFELKKLQPDPSTKHVSKQANTLTALDISSSIYKER